MTTTTRPAFSTWPLYNARLRDTIRGMTDKQLAIQPTRERWPLWGEHRPPGLSAGLLAMRLRRRSPAPRRPSRTPGTTARATTTSSTCSAATRWSRRSTRRSASSMASSIDGRSRTSTRTPSPRVGQLLGSTPAAGSISACPPTTSGTPPSSTSPSGAQGSRRSTSGIDSGRSRTSPSYSLSYSSWRRSQSWIPSSSRPFGARSRIG